MSVLKIIKRFSGEVLFEATLGAEFDDASEGKRLGEAVKLAVKSRAYLSRAYLSRAYLSGADLSGADLSRANFTPKTEPDAIPVIEKIDAKILAAIEAGGELNMGSWHGVGGVCRTTHCRAGWAVHLGGEKGKALEAQFGSQLAGAMIYRASRPGVPAPWFFAPTDMALADIKKCAAEQGAA